jgi:hypothetical protein
LILLLAVVAVLAAAAYGVYYFTQTPDPGPAPITKYGERASDFIAEFFTRGFDADGNKALSYEEFAKGYVDFKLNKSERETYDVKEAFSMLDANRDGVIDKTDIKIFDQKRDVQDAHDRREDLAAQGLVVQRWNGVEVILNPTQRDWLDAEDGAFKRGDLPFAGTFFDHRWFGDWEEGKPAGTGVTYRLKRASWARVTLGDGTVHEGFVSEIKDLEIAKKRGLAPGKVFVLASDARVSAYAVERVQAIEYFEGSAQAKYLKAVSEASLSDTARQLEIARQCIKGGMQADALTIYKRVLIFQHDNQEALDALGYKLNGRQYVKVK